MCFVLIIHRPIYRLLSVTFKLFHDTANNGKVIRSSTAMAQLPLRWAPLWTVRVNERDRKILKLQLRVDEPTDRAPLVPVVKMLSIPTV